VGVVQSLVRFAANGVGERSSEGAALVQLMGKANGQVSLPTGGDQITDNSIKGQSHRARSASAERLRIAAAGRDLSDSGWLY